MSREKLILIFIYLIIYQIGNAQQSNFFIGTSIGLNYTDQEIKKVDLYRFTKPKYSTYSSLFIEYKLKGNNFLQLDLAYEQKGLKVKDLLFYNPITGNTTGIVDIHLNFGYLTLPLMLNHKYLKRIYDKPFILVFGYGAYGALLLNRIDKIKGLNIRDSIINKGILFEKKQDYGLCGKIAIEYPINDNLYFFTDVLLNYGLYDVVKLPDRTTFYYGYSSAKHRVINFKFGIKYNI